MGITLAAAVEEAYQQLIEDKKSLFSNIYLNTSPSIRKKSAKLLTNFNHLKNLVRSIAYTKRRRHHVWNYLDNQYGNRKEQKRSLR